MRDLVSYLNLTLTICNQEEDQVDAGTTQNDEDATKLPDSKLPQKVQVL